MPDISFTLNKGHQLKSYVIDSVLGVGGFGITYLARHRHLHDQWVAIKEYFPAGAVARDAKNCLHPLSDDKRDVFTWGLARFLDEARLLSKFEHPNIVRVHDYFEEHNTAYMVMNHVRAKSLRKFVEEKGCLSERRLKRLLLPLLEALELVHGHGVLHRDITPSNVLIQEDNTPVLIDFGSARYGMRSRQMGHTEPTFGQELTALCTAGYSPIEQYEQTRQGPWTDIYGLGATVYFAVFGERPIDALHRSGEIRTHQQDPLPAAGDQPLTEYTRELLHAIDAALKVDPVARPQDIPQWRQMLGVWAVPQTGKKFLRSRTHKSISTPRVKSLTAWHYAACGAILSIGFVAFLLLQGDSAEDLAHRADQTLASMPLDTNAIQTSRRLYLKALNKRPDHQTALRGLDTTEHLTRYMRALDDQQLDSAREALDTIRQSLDDSVHKLAIMEPSNAAIDSLRNVLEASRVLVVDSFSQASWSSAESLLDQAKTNQPTHAAAVSKALLHLQAANAELNGVDGELDRHSAKRNFMAARNEIGEAEKLLQTVSVRNTVRLTVAHALIAKREAQWNNNRLADASRAVSLGRSTLESGALDQRTLSEARQSFKSALALDPDNTNARLNLDGVDRLEQWRSALDAGDLALAEDRLAQAQPVLLQAQIDQQVLTSANSQIARKRVDDWWSQLRRLLTQSVPSDALLTTVDQLAKQIIEIEDTPSARSARSVVKHYQESRASLESERYADARRALAHLKRSVTSAKVDNGLVITLVDEINLREATAKISTANSILETDLLLKESLDSARMLYKEAEALHVDAAKSASQGQELIGELSNVAEMLENKLFDQALTTLRETEHLTRALTISNAAIDKARGDIEQTKDVAERVALQRRLDNALTRLVREPLDAATWQLVDNELRDDKTSADKQQAGQNALQALADAKAYLDDNQFAEARSAVDQASNKLVVFGITDIKQAEVEINRVQQAWQLQRDQKVSALIIHANSQLMQAFDQNDLLAVAENTYSQALKLDSTSAQARAGVNLTTVLSKWHTAFDRDDLDAAEQALKQARLIAKSAKIDTSFLDQARADTSEARQSKAQALLDTKIEAKLEEARLAFNQWDDGDEALDRVNLIYRDVLTLQDNDKRGQAGIAAVASVRKIQQLLTREETSQTKDELDRFATHAKAANIDPDVHTRLVAKYTQVKETVSQRRTTAIASARRVINAAQTIQNAPFDSETSQTVQTTFTDLPQDDSRREIGIRAAQNLRLARTYLQEERYVKATAAIVEVESALNELSGSNIELKKARNAIIAAQKTALQATQNKYAKIKEKISDILTTKPLSYDDLVTVSEHYNSAADLNPDSGSDRASASIAITLAKTTQAMDNLEFVSADRLLNQVSDESQSIVVNTEAESALIGIIESMTNDLQARTPTSVDTTTLVTKAISLLEPDPLNTESLKLAEDLGFAAMKIQRDEPNVLALFKVVDALKQVQIAVASGDIDVTKQPMKQVAEQLESMGIKADNSRLMQNARRSMIE